MENLNLQSLKYLAGVKDTIAECGMGPTGSNTPASINITAGSGQELTGMLKDIMNLAGVHKVEPRHMPVDTPDAGPTTVVSAPKAAGSMMPDMHKLMAIVDGPEMVKDSMNPEETEEGMVGAGLGGMAGGAVGDVAGTALGSLVGGPIGGLVGGVAGDIAGTALGAKVGDGLTGDDNEETKEEYDNSPNTQIQQDPLGQYGDINSGDHRERQKGLPVAKPVEETFKTLFAEYEKFISESKVSTGTTLQPKGPKEVDVPAYLRKSRRPGQAAAQASNDELNKRAGVKVWTSKRTSEGAVKQLAVDLKDKTISDSEFEEKYGKSRNKVRQELTSSKKGTVSNLTDIKKKVNENSQDSDVIYINCTNNGVPGAAVETTKSFVESIMRELNSEIQAGRIKPLEVKKMHRHLAKELKRMLPTIMKHGQAFSSDGEVYTKKIFDADLVHLAVYDYIANGKQIQVVPVSPGSGTIQ